MVKSFVLVIVDINKNDINIKIVLIKEYIIVL